MPALRVSDITIAENAASPASNLPPSAATFASAITGLFTTPGEGGGAMPLPMTHCAVAR